MTIQDIMRCKLREDMLCYVDIFLSSTNQDYINILKKELPQATLYYITNTPKRDSVEQYILSTLSNQETLLKSQIKRDCHLSDDTWKQYISSPTFILFLNSHHIISKKFSLVRT
jgi:hypothetical protein